jgi:hypothetical protein
MIGCEYTTRDRGAIHHHHIVPKSMGGSESPHNKVWLCPNCHHRIYVEGSKGIHSVKRDDYVIIKEKMFSTGGYLLLIETKTHKDVIYAIDEFPDYN